MGQITPAMFDVLPISFHTRAAIHAAGRLPCRWHAAADHSDHATIRRHSDQQHIIIKYGRQFFV